MDTEPPGFSYFEFTDTNLLAGVTAILVLLFCAAVISGAEVAFFSLSEKDVQEADRINLTKATIVQRLMMRPRKLLATLLIANNFLNIAIVTLFFTFASPLFAQLQNDFLRLGVMVAVITFIILFFGEVIPKIYANRNNVKFVLRVVYPVSVLDKLLTPFSMPMRSMIIALQEKLGKQHSSFSVDQLSQALELTSTEDSSKEEQKILEGIVSFGNTDTKQVMSPRIDIFAIDIGESYAEVFDKLVQKGFSRVPVYRDNIDQIVGVLFIKDLLPYIDMTDFDWRKLVREPFFVPESKKLDDLLKDFQSMKSHLAIVVDEYGGTSGLVTLEDVIEEIVGDISDEFDDEHINYSQIDDRNFLFEGKIALKDFYRIIDADEDSFEQSKGDAETLAGFILELTGSFPKKGHKLRYDKCQFIIEAVDNKRIKQVKVTLD